MTCKLSSLRCSVRYPSIDRFEEVFCTLYQYIVDLRVYSKYLYKNQKSKQFNEVQVRLIKESETKCYGWENRLQNLVDSMCEVLADLNPGIPERLSIDLIDIKPEKDKCCYLSEEQRLQKLMHVSMFANIPLCGRSFINAYRFLFDLGCHIKNDVVDHFKNELQDLFQDVLETTKNLQYINKTNSQKIRESYWHHKKKVVEDCLEILSESE